MKCTLFLCPIRRWESSFDLWLSGWCERPPAFRPWTLKCLAVGNLLLRFGQGLGQLGKWWPRCRRQSFQFGPWAHSALLFAKKCSYRQDLARWWCRIACPVKEISMSIQSAWKRIVFSYPVEVDTVGNEVHVVQLFKAAEGISFRRSAQRVVRKRNKKLPRVSSFGKLNTLFFANCRPCVRNRRDHSCHRKTD